VLTDKVVVVTGAGRGLGREYALELARHHASVVVNDLGGDLRGAGRDPSAAEEVAALIVAGGGRAVVDTTDVSAPGAGEVLVTSALHEFGRLDAVVNNAGILRDRTLVNLERQDWDAVLAVHLTGTYEVTRAAARHWRSQSKQGETPDARVICTTSASGLYGNVGQANYAAAKAGIVGLVLTLAQELAPYGVMVNALSPGALTRMTSGLFGLTDAVASGPANVAPAVAWLLGPAAAGLTGAILECEGGTVGFAQPWAHGPQEKADGGVWSYKTLCEAMTRLTSPGTGGKG
jgi:NAD(P)-dependent dehydrogenase (short-subunit alcohol dehydrogenase family)